jgi:HAMP domain-containing protein
VYLEAAGAMAALLSLIWAIVSWRRHLARVRPVNSARAQVAAKGAKGQPSGPRRPGQTRRARMMERMEERWRRRQEGDRRM